jgi:hypothetical protein
MRCDKLVGIGSFPIYVNFGLRQFSDREPLRETRTVCTHLTSLYKTVRKAAGSDTASV